MMQTLFIEFRVTDAKAWESLDGDQESEEVARLIDDALKRAEAGNWTGSAQRRTSLLFYCLVKDEVSGKNAILTELGRQGLRPYLELKQIRVM